MTFPGPSRREFLQLMAAVPLSVQGHRESTPSQTSLQEQVLPGLRVVRGSVNTVVFERNGKTLLVDSGELSAAPGGAVPEWVLFTHHHRDQASAAHQLAAKGTKIAVPAEEKRLFAEAEQFWNSADNIIDHRYDFRPHLFTLTHSVPVSRTVTGGETFTWQDLRFEIISTPAHTDGSVSYLVEIGGKRVALTGDLIHSPGKIWEFYSLQKRFPGMRGDYWGFGGAVADLQASLAKILAKKPDLLIPSHGEIMSEPAHAISLLTENLDRLMANYLSTAAWRIYFKGIFPDAQYPMLPPLPAVFYPTWIRDIASTTKAISPRCRASPAATAFWIASRVDCGKQRADLSGLIHTCLKKRARSITSSPTIHRRRSRRPRR